MQEMTVTILGSGTSMGVPMAGCDCRVCRSEDPKDQRLRPSVLVRIGEAQILIDTSLDYRQQMLRAGVRRLDAVLYTHHHVDHILGMDDLRSFNLLNKTSIPIYGMAETMQNIRRIFNYVFSENDYPSSLPRLEIRLIDEQPFRAAGIPVLPVPLLHGTLPVLGFRIGNFAYCTDVSFIPESSFRRLEGLEVLILDALRPRPHPTHFSLAEAIEAAQRIGAKKTYFTHISHQILHAETEAALPENIHLGYDGLELQLGWHDETEG